MTTRYRVWRLLVRILFDENSVSANGSLREQLPGDEKFWQEMISVANANLVTSALWNNLRAKNLDGRATDDAKEYLDSFNVLNLHKNACIRKQGLECIAMLNKADIEPMPIKGLAYQLGPSGNAVEDRFLVDIDIMVPAESASQAQLELAKYGYEEIPTNAVDYNTHLHLKPVWRKGLPATVEIHRAPVTNLYYPALPTPDVWNNASRETYRGVQYRLPSPTDAAMIVFLHNAMIDRCLSLYMIPLRAYLDANRLRAQYDHGLDWTSNLKRAGQIDATDEYRRFANILYRLSGNSFLQPEHFTVADRIHYQASRLVAAMPGLERWAERLDRLSADQILDQYNARDNRLSINAYRTREIAAMLLRGVRNLV